MSDEQKGCFSSEDPAPADGNESAQKKGGAANSYYYDDGTGYEIYRGDIDDTDAKEPDEAIQEEGAS